MQEIMVDSPRVALVTPDGILLLTRYRETNWWGLPGGNVEQREKLKADRLGLIPTLEREVQEECGLKIKLNESKLIFIGIYEIFSVNLVLEKITHIFSPIFAYMLSEFGKFNTDTTCVVNLKDNIAWPVFPDARIVIGLLRGGVLKGGLQEIEPQFLVNANFYFQINPRIGLMMEGASAPGTSLSFPPYSLPRSAVMGKVEQLALFQDVEESDL